MFSNSSSVCNDDTEWLYNNDIFVKVWKGYFLFVYLNTIHLHFFFPIWTIIEIRDLKAERVHFERTWRSQGRTFFYRINLPGRYYFFCYHDNKGMFAFVTTKKSWHEKYNSLWVPFCLSFLRFEPQSISKNILFNSYMRRRSIYSTEGRICQVTYFVTTLLLVQIYFFRVLKRAVRINLVCH